MMQYVTHTNVEAYMRKVEFDLALHYVASIHEAGHACACRFLDFPGGEASILTDEDSDLRGYAMSGSVDYCAELWAEKGQKTYRGLTPVQARACIAAAGVAAELVICNGQTMNGHQSDYETFCALIEHETERDELFQFTVDLMGHYASIIRGVAHYLRESFTMSGEALDLVVDCLLLDHDTSDAS